MLHKRIEEELLHLKQINKQYQDAFQDLLTEYGETLAGNMGKSLEELKLGVEQGLNLNEIAIILGKDASDTHENRNIYLQYREFFQERVSSGYAGGVKAFINAVRQGADYEVPVELVLQAKTIDDLRKKAPVKKVESQLAESADLQLIDTAGAYYVGVQTLINGEGDILYRCYSPSDKDYYETYNEFDAMKWVRNKNNHPKIVTRNKQK